ncbi:hypothetical protein [Streptomyces sp. enrichment culture]|uniref:hypothetical protein n=1 Tax=Streptomyces sp. enrichment culture TaxID=1795815 RepID=UPI003F57D1B7
MIISAGAGTAQAAMPALVMDSVPVTETAPADGVDALVRSIGTSTASGGHGGHPGGMTKEPGARRGSSPPRAGSA